MNRPRPAHPAAVAVRKNLRRLREHRGLSLEAAANRLGMRHVTLGSYERGDRALTVVKLVPLAEFYGVPVADMFDPFAVAMRCSGLRPSLALDEQP